MGKVILYIAKSLDGYIARKDGSLDWLTSIPNPKVGDYGYQALLDKIDTLVMGRKSYEELLKFGIEWPYESYQTYVVSSNSNYPISTPQTTLIGSEIVDLIKSVKTKNEKDIWLVGGGELNSLLIKNQLVDHLHLTIVPRMIGDGIPLFSPHSVSSDWELVRTQVFETGLVNLEWNFKKQE